MAIHWAIDLTARLRYSPRWEDGRDLLRRRGIDPMRCIVAYMGPGGLGTGSTCCELILPDAKAAVMDFAADPASSRLISLEDFEELPEGAEGSDIGQVRELVRSDGAGFDALVLEYFAGHSELM